MTRATKVVPVEQLHEKLIYEPDTGNFYLKAPRSPNDIGRAIGYMLSGYWMLYVCSKGLKAHRVAWAMHYGEWPETSVDHIDRDKLNNRIANLRLANKSQNAANSRDHGAVKAKGVHWHKRWRKYNAQIKVNGKTKCLGYYHSIDEAAHAYNKAAIMNFGEFALLNPVGVDKPAATQPKEGASDA